MRSVMVQQPRSRTGGLPWRQVGNLPTSSKLQTCSHKGGASDKLAPTDGSTDLRGRFLIVPPAGLFSHPKAPAQAGARKPRETHPFAWPAGPLAIGTVHGFGADRTSVPLHACATA